MNYFGMITLGSISSSPNSLIQKVLVISSGIALFSYSNPESENLPTDEQLLSGFLSAFQTFSSDLGTEINAVKFRQLTIFYRVIKNEDINSDEVSIVFIADQSANEKNIRIRMEYACQIFVHKYIHHINNNIIDSDTFVGFQNELMVIINAELSKIEELLPKNFLQVLIKELQGSVPIKQLEKLLKKYDFIFNPNTQTLIVPGDLTDEKTEEIVKHLESATKTLFGKGLWDKAYDNASKAENKIIA